MATTAAFALDGTGGAEMSAAGIAAIVDQVTAHARDADVTDPEGSGRGASRQA